jgi:LemA protein
MTVIYMEIGILIIIVILAVILSLFFVIFYNKLVTQRNRVENAWAQIEVQIKRRHDLIPNCWKQ